MYQTGEYYNKIIKVVVNNVLGARVAFFYGTFCCL